MNDNAPTTYATIAEAEAAITAAGYQRDNQRHVWVQSGRTATVLRTTDDPPKFFIKWG